MSSKSNLTLHDYYKSHGINPIGIDLYDKSTFQLHIKQRNNLYVNKLHIPRLTWRNACVLEVGSANGENAIVNAMNGTKIDIIEPSKDFTSNMERLFTYHGYSDNIQRIINKPIEKVKLDKKYDIIVAEGFVSQLNDRKNIIKKLFNGLDENGLLIMSTSDPFGSCIEQFKANFFKKYTDGIENIDRLCEISKQFFYEDFMKLNTKRPYENWIKDVIISPLTGDFHLWGFDEIVSCIKHLNPVYYSSHPSYTIGTDYSWYKDVKKENIMDIVGMYLKKRIEFIIGSDDISKISKLFEEMESITDNPISYKDCKILRENWGTPNHYIVFRKKT